MPETKVASKVPLRIGEYEVIRKVGEGGLAEIYLATQKSLNREVAIKVLHKKISSNEEMVKRFERESITLARMSHPNIVHIIEKGEDNGRLFFAMQYVEGTNFKDILRDGSWTRERKLDIIIQVLKALDYAHKNGVIHRDIKPANILIDKEDNALVADFGIAQFLEGENVERTESGVVMGTYAYMSPEQKEDSTNVDHTTDLYAVGVMIYEVLTGMKPMGRFKLPSEFDSTVPAGYDDIIVKALQHNPRERYQKAVEIKDDLLAVMHSHDQAALNNSGPIGKVKTFIGHCSFLDTLKDGMFGSTYLVEDRTSHELYVIKKQNKPEMGLKESKLLSSLRHPNILPIYGAGGDDHKIVLVMQYAQGGSLADRLVKPLHWREAHKLMRQIVSGLNFAHKNNIIHGNLRPSNILFDRNDVVKISDFALMPHYDKNAINWYMAPEHRKGKLSDIYATGIIFYQLLTNRMPTFDTYGNFVWIEGTRTTTPQMKKIIEKMIRTVPSERYESFSEIEEAVMMLDSQESQHGPDTISHGTKGKSVLIWGTIAAAAAIILILFLTGKIHF